MSDVALPSTLLTLENLAAMLHRTPSGVRATLHCHTEFASRLKSARVKLGRRIYFRRDLIDQLIVESTGI